MADTKSSGEPRRLRSQPHASVVLHHRQAEGDRLRHRRTGRQGRGGIGGQTEKRGRGGGSQGDEVEGGGVKWATQLGLDENKWLRFERPEQHRVWVRLMMPGVKR
jgi:hypothetical protein